MHDGSFLADRTFDSLDEAFNFLSSQYTLRPPVRLDLVHPSGLSVLSDAPMHLFRGEPGRFPQTLSSVERLETFALRDGRKLSPAEMQSLKIIWPDILKCFHAPGYSQDTLASLCLFEHYGLPTWTINFTRRLEHAFSFAAGGDSEDEACRLAVLPLRFFSGQVINLTEHRLAVRAQRQEAFGVVPDRPVRDLKSLAARKLCKISWYEFPVSDSERVHWKAKRNELLRTEDDPTAGNMRHEVAQYIAEHQMSPAIAEWLIEKIPVCAPIPPEGGVGYMDLTCPENTAAPFQPDPLKHAAGLPG